MRDIYQDCTSQQGERNDCTVRTAATLLDISYDQAHALMAELGRKPKRGAHFWKLAKKFNLLQRFYRPRKRVKTILAQLGRGRFAVRISHHVFTVVDGRIVSDALSAKCYDRQLRSIVKDVWEYRREDWLPAPIK